MKHWTTLLVWLLTTAGSLFAQASDPSISDSIDRLATSVEAAADAYVAEDRTAAEFEDALTAADQAYRQLQTALGVAEDLQRNVPTRTPLGNAAQVPLRLRAAAAKLRQASTDYTASQEPGAGSPAHAALSDAVADSAEGIETALNNDALIHDEWQILAILLVLLAALFALAQHQRYGKFFHVIPLLVFCYFVPTLLSNTGLIPISSPLYDAIKKYLLPASLVLLVLSVDVPAIFGLGRNALIMFLVATATIVIGGPIAMLLLGWMVPESMGDQAWKGLAALAGSWIGGGANFVAIGESVGATASTMGMIVVVDIAVAECWMFFLLTFAGREKAMDDKIGANRESIDTLRHKVEDFEKSVARPTSLPDLLILLAIAFGITVGATALAKQLPDIGSIVRGFTWVVLICTTIALILSFTRLRKLEGAGASKVGSVFLYLLVASIGAHAQFSKVLEVPSLVLIGAVWMLIHAVGLFLARRWTKSPIFFLAIGSRANVGGAASAPILASAFHPSLAPVGVLLAVGGYVLGTYAGLACAALLELVGS